MLRTAVRIRPSIQKHQRPVQTRQYSHYGRTADTFHPAYYQQARRKHGPRAARGNEAFRPAFCHRTGSYYYGGVYLIAHSSRRILIGGDDLTALHHLYVCITGTLQIWFQLIRTAHKAVSYTHLRAHETKANLVCRLLLEKKQQKL